MIDTNELRRLAQAATPGPDGVSLSWVKLLQDFQKGANPAAVSELLDCLEEAEADAIEQARLNGMGASREAALMAKLEAAEKDIALKERIIDSLGAELNAVSNERDCLLDALREMLVTAESVNWDETFLEGLALRFPAWKENEMTDIVDRLNDSLSAGYSELRKEAAAEITRLRSKIAAMEKQEPVAQFNWSKGELEWLRPWNYRTMNMKSLYLAPGAKGE